jgi:hypothetical protein
MLHRSSHTQFVGRTVAIVANHSRALMCNRRNYDIMPLDAGKNPFEPIKKNGASGDTWSGLQEVDSIFSITSDCFFFAGSVCYLIVSHWRASNVDEDSVKATRISTIAVGGSIFYMFNAGVSIALAVYKIRCNPRGSARWRASVWNLVSNLLFGIGATIDTANCINLIFNGIDPSGADRRSLSAYLYFLSGLCICYVLNFSGRHYHQLLVGTGDLLFLLGSVSDLIITYVTQYLRNSTEVNKFWLISSSLWLVNSVLYLVADILALMSLTTKQKLRLRSSAVNQLSLVQLNPHTV